MLLVLTAPVMVAAQDDPFGKNEIQNINAYAGDQPSDLGLIITNIINWVLGFLALVAVIIVLIGGFEWMTAGGNDEKVATAKKRLTYGLIGLAIIFLAWAIVTFVFTSLTNWTTT